MFALQSVVTKFIQNPLTELTEMRHFSQNVFFWHNKGTNWCIFVIIKCGLTGSGHIVLVLLGKLNTLCSGNTCLRIYDEVFIDSKSIHSFSLVTDSYFLVFANCWIHLASFKALPCTISGVRLITGTVFSVSAQFVKHYRAIVFGENPGKCF